MIPRASLILGFALLCLPVIGAARAGEVLAGPLDARVLRVVDGDTFVAEALIWPGQRVTVNVRLRGIDAPELRGKCAAEKEAARRSRAALEALIGEAVVKIRNVGGGKYYGRVLADVALADDTPVGALLIERALARPYDGGRRTSLCEGMS